MEGDGFGGVFAFLLLWFGLNKVLLSERRSVGGGGLWCQWLSFGRCHCTFRYMYISCSRGVTQAGFTAALLCRNFENFEA